MESSPKPTKVTTLCGLYPPASLIAFKNTPFMRFMISACCFVDPFASLIGSKATRLEVHANFVAICCHSLENLFSSLLISAPGAEKSNHSQLSWWTLTIAYRPREVICSRTVATRSSHLGSTVYAGPGPILVVHVTGCFPLVLI